MSWSQPRFILTVAATVVLAWSCSSSATWPPAPSEGTSFQPPVSPSGTMPFQPPVSPDAAGACALDTTNGYNFILVRGATAHDDCQLLLTDLAASTVQKWRSSSGQIPPSTSSVLYCDVIADTGNRVTVWGGSMVGLGSSICSEAQRRTIVHLPTVAPGCCYSRLTVLAPAWDRAP